MLNGILEVLDGISSNQHMLAELMNKIADALIEGGNDECLIS
jgi:biopolymer transport protein ExbB/TolQ